MDAAVLEKEDSELTTTETEESSAENDHAKTKISNLKELTIKLLREVQSLTDVRTLDLSHGLDFYDEVSRFEVELIRRALLQTGGHQGRAARLLNLKVTTLNSKIKHYNISLESFVKGYPFIETVEVEARRDF